MNRRRSWLKEAAESLAQESGLRETFTARSTGALTEARVSRSEGRISDVAFLGRVSRNNRVYSDQALRDAARMYEGVQLFIDHPTDSEMRARDGVRRVGDLLGVAENVRVVGDQVRGDAVLVDSPHRDLVLSLAERAPEAAGFSHRARGPVRERRDGTRIVKGLDEVLAIELVTEPATVSGLHESTQQDEDEELEAMRRRIFGDGGEDEGRASRRTRPIREEDLAELSWRLFG